MLAVTGHGGNHRRPQETATCPSWEVLQRDCLANRGCRADNQGAKFSGLLATDGAGLDNTVGLPSRSTAASRRSTAQREHRGAAGAATVFYSRGSHGGVACGGSAETRRPEKQELYVARRGTRHVGLGFLPKAPAFRPG
jgi:hypothetical protein